MTLAERILAAHAGKQSVSPGEFITAKVDFIMTNDVSAPLAIQEFRRLGVKKVFDPDKIVLLADHFTPNKDLQAAEQAKLMREFAQEQGVIWFESGRLGIEHVLLPEQGLVLPGDLMLGGDSHTTTYGAVGAFATGMGSTDIACAMATGETWLKVPPSLKLIYHGELPRWVGGKDLILYTIGQIGVDGARYAAMEFAGDAIAGLSMDGRFTMANMAVEAGAKAGLFYVDDKTLSYVKPRAKREYKVVHPDFDAQYTQTFDWDVSALEPQVAFPHLPSNTRPVSEAASVNVDQAVVGSCTNGRMEDLRLAAGILAGKQVHPRVRLVVIPGTQEVYLEAMKEGLLEAFVRAGGSVSPPTCGPCIGGFMGILAAGERCVATTNRNFIGRMGSTDSEIYLANPAVVAASAITGRITHPQEVG
ncbi:MAG: 3-isopropylmalate dehydratase large subunit [Dehalococcoidia bacterium]|jgi:3-isopropylmalate/(R)-2-methylmalate dehydratase large subunit|nr:3-isopropylmalate dehydratase large subunit [Dehalococcoidia bacterium]